MKAWTEPLLDFWFVAHGEKDWFGGGTGFDAALAACFASAWERERQHPASTFLVDGRTALAAILLFDQVPRNIHRGHANAFATDLLARALAEGVIDARHDRAMSPAERLFAYLPFEHSENAADQDRAVRLIGELGRPDWTAFAEEHRAMIARFGRFPQRNAALGRADRPGEADAIRASRW